MSGQLVGIVYAASPRLRAGGLSQNGFMALLAIAEKCHPRTRQGCVRWDHICDGLYGVSKRTAHRAVRELREAKLVEVVKPGWANQHGEGYAPIYELRIVPPVSSSTKLDGDKSELDDDKSELDDDKHPPVTSTDSTLDGSIDGSIGGRARAGARTAQPDSRPPATPTPPKNPSQKQNPAPDGAKKPRPQLGPAIHKLLKKTSIDQADNPNGLSPRALAAIQAARANLDRATQLNNRLDGEATTTPGRPAP